MIFLSFLLPSHTVHAHPMSCLQAFMLYFPMKGEEHEANPKLGGQGRPAEVPLPVLTGAPYALWQQQLPCSAHLFFQLALPCCGHTFPLGVETMVWLFPQDPHHGWGSIHSAKPWNVAVKGHLCPSSVDCFSVSSLTKLCHTILNLSSACAQGSVLFG